MIKKILAGMAVVAGFFSFYWRGQSQKHKSEATHQSARADSAEESHALSQRINKNVSEVEQKHRKEQVDEKNSFDAGDRNQLDNNW